MTLHSTKEFAIDTARGIARGEDIPAFPGSQPVSYYPAGSEIYGQGDRAGDLYQVEFGCVRVYRLLADGRRQISAFHMPGELFGFETDGTHHFFAEAVNATGVRVVRPAAADRLAVEILPLALKGLVRAQEHLLVIGRQNATERVAAFLLDMAERQGGLASIELPMSRGDIGDYLGLTIETVSRVFTKLKEKAVIRLTGVRNVELLRTGVLEDLCA